MRTMLAFTPPGLAAVALLVVACGSPEPTGPTREEFAGIQRPAAAPSPPRAPTQRDERAWAREPAPVVADLATPPPAAPALALDEPGPASGPPEGAGAAEAPRARALGDELRAAISDIGGCLDVTTAASLGGALAVDVSATALPSGHLQRASVSASGLPAPALACIRARVEAATLRTPIEGAPRTVSTTLRYEVRAEVTSEPRRRFAADPPPPGDVQGPALVLPALGDPIAGEH